MAVEQGYPITLVHPQHSPAKLVQGDEPGQPERFPLVEVNGASQEAQYRSLGYLRFGESPLPKIDHHEFPKILRHPEYAPAVEGKVEMRFENGRPAGQYTIPAVPAVMPDVTVMNAEQEEKARESGYRPAGEYDKAALRAVLRGTINEERYVPQEYPKWIEVEGEDGKPKSILVERDPNKAVGYVPDGKTYPRWEGGVLVQDPNIEPPPDPNEFPKWVHRDGIPSDESKLANNRIEEAAIRARWARVVESPEVKEQVGVERVMKAPPPAKRAAA